MVSDSQIASGPIPGRPGSQRQAAAWRLALLHAAPVSLFVFILFYYWFAIANRYVIFLYDHLGATPFDERTSSRYWMTGLVVAGAVLVLYTTANWFVARIYGLRYVAYRPPAWWRVWLLCVLPLGVGIPAITMSVNRPTLPLGLAVACAVVALIGLGCALAPAVLAAQQPAELGWLVLGGMGLAPVLLLARALELPGHGLVSRATAWTFAGGGVAVGAIWLAAISGLRVRRRQPMGFAPLYVSGLSLSYLLMPLVHYLLFTPSEFRYISAASNFFAYHPAVQFMALSLAAILTIAAVHLQKGLRRRFCSR